MNYILRRIFFGIIAIIFCLQLSIAQETFKTYITHDGGQREALMYIPASYDGSEAFPLVLNFHGYGSNNNEQMFYGDMRQMADTANFIIAHPLGLPDLLGTTHFNVGGWTVGSTVDDVGFTSDLLDTLSAQYNIDQGRIYSTGMSNGGFMSYKLACQLSDRIAAIASVTGSMTPEIYDQCDAQRPVPILHIHGTADAVVTYTGEAWTRSVQESVDYWVAHNNCDPDPIIIDIDDTSVEDGSTVEHFIYANGDRGSTTEHFKITGGGHQWAGNPFGFQGTNYDISASFEVWKFFSRYDINGLIDPVATIDNINEVQLTVSPNPAADIISVQADIEFPTDYQIISQSGQIINEGTLHTDDAQINVQELKVGLYFLKVENAIQKILIEK